MYANDTFIVYLERMDIPLPEDYEHLECFIRSHLKLEMQFLERKYPNGLLVYQHMEYKDYDFILLGLAPNKDNVNADEIYEFMCSQVCFNLLDAYILETDYYNSSSIRCVAPNLNDLASAAKVLSSVIRHSFLFRSSRDYILLCALNKYASHDAISYAYGEAKEFAICSVVSGCVLLHYLEHEEEYSLLSGPFGANILCELV